MSESDLHRLNDGSIAPLPIKMTEVRIPNLSMINECYWKYDRDKSELAGLGYVCPRCGGCRLIKLPQIDEDTGMVAWD